VDGDPLLLDGRHVSEARQRDYGYEATLIPERHARQLCDGLSGDPYLLFLRNSLAVAAGSTLLSMIIAVLGAYASPG
jgi:ABC-type glycerol-3-phosphate transport system permease component